MPVTERADHDAAYPAVADGLTLYLWREQALRLSRRASAAGLPPIAVTAVAALTAAAAFALFWTANYWPGLLFGFLFGLLAIVAEQLARLRPAKSDAVLRGFALAAPPLWWWAWEHGLAAYGRPITPLLATIILWAIIGGYAGQCIVEWLAVRRFGVAINRWRPFDSRFRLVSADRNSDLVILLGAMLFGIPRLGLELVAWWTLISLIVAAVRLAQMNEQTARGRPITSWLGS